jgi:hypothetical protein
VGVGAGVGVAVGDALISATLVGDALEDVNAVALELPVGLTGFGGGAAHPTTRHTTTATAEVATRVIGR